MFLLQFCIFIIFVSSGVHSKVCSDCVNYVLCPNALNLARNGRTTATLEFFKSAFCGFDQIGGEKSVKVCCSDFSRTNANEKTPEDIRIAKHDNLKLLPADCGFIARDRIVGGVTAELFEFPWMVLISHKTRDGLKFMCGGTLINKRYVLTAAHCVKNKQVAGVRLGENKLDISPEIKDDVVAYHKDVRVENFTIHENYQSPPRTKNDIALLRLATDINITQINIQPICLPITDRLRRQDLSSKSATVAGWGVTENSTRSDALRKAAIPIYATQDCSSLYNRFTKPGEPDITAEQLCAGAPNKDSCNGDSGGPLMLVETSDDNSHRLFQYGIVSYGPKQCGSDSPGVYTDVRKYVGWILDNIKP